MGKKNNSVKKSTLEIRKGYLFYYTEKFFNKWMSRYDYPELNYQQKHYLMKKFWADGTISAVAVKSASDELAGLIDSGVIDMKENKIIFCPWAPDSLYNIYDFPTKARAINTRGVKFIPTEALDLDKEIVIGYAQNNHKSVFSSIEAKLNELVDIEMKKRLARISQSQPFLFVAGTEDKNTIKSLRDQLDGDEPYMFSEFSEPTMAKGFTSGAPYIVDKLEADRQKVENDILTILGCNNVGVGEKKEHLVVDEVNANNQDIREQSESYTFNIKDFFDRVYKAFNYKVNVIDLRKEMNMVYLESEPNKEDNEDED